MSAGKKRTYYTDFEKALPKDIVILTAGCACPPESQHKEYHTLLDGFQLSSPLMLLKCWLKTSISYLYNRRRGYESAS
ncbi:hypothetical protein [Methanosarcina sp.]|uniref:hypothetical protein n=1 Tax=Methanosarcina sp. TaxID=2213 RepID=UPI00399C4122